MMMLIMVSCVMMIPLVSPIKVAFSVTMSSVAVSVMSYMVTSTLFPSCAVVISFSSGMMILFCYCAMLSNYESKKTYKMKTMLLTTMALMSMMKMSENKINGENMETVTSSSESPSIMYWAMLVVIVTMICINKSVFSPQKTLVGSY